MMLIKPKTLKSNSKLNIHETYIQRCLQIGKLGLGMTRPNPMVGALIVHENKILNRKSNRRAAY